MLERQHLVLGSCVAEGIKTATAL